MRQYECAGTTRLRVPQRNMTWLAGIPLTPKTLMALATLVGLVNVAVTVTSTAGSAWSASGALNSKFAGLDNIQEQSLPVPEVSVSASAYPQPLGALRRRIGIGNNANNATASFHDTPTHANVNASDIHISSTRTYLVGDEVPMPRPPRIAYITFTHLNGTQRFEDMILRSIDTWLPAQEPYFVVISNMWKQQFQDLFKVNVPSAYQKRIHAVFVDCPEGQFGLSPCCKQEQGLLYVWSTYAHQYEWFVFMDDDIYMRPNFLEGYVATLPAHDEPIVLTSGAPPHPLGQAGYMRSKKAYNCSKDHEFTYPWASLAIYNRYALRLISNGLRLGGLTKQCLEFRVTHDTGNAILHWMYSIPTIFIAVPLRPDRKKNHFLALHGVGRCETKKCNMHVLHKWYTRTYRQPPNRSDYRYAWHNVSGFKTLQHYAQYGSPERWTTVWHTMPTSACTGGNFSVAE